MEFITKDGKKITFEFTHYGEERDINATPGEQQIFEFIKSLCPTCELVRKSDDYLTAEAFACDVARFKFTDRARWVLFPYLPNNKKRRFEKIEDLDGFTEDLMKSYEEAREIAALSGR